MVLGLYGPNAFCGAYEDYLMKANLWAPGTWHHICVTYDGTRARLYADGGLFAEGPRNWNLVLSRARIGRSVDDAAEYWDGMVDDVRLYDRVLSPGEISVLYEAGKPR